LPLTDVQLSQLLIKTVSSAIISKAAFVVVTQTFRLSLIQLPDNLLINNAAVLMEQMAGTNQHRI
jgi:hypothetical protein